MKNQRVSAAVAKLAGQELARRRKHPMDRWGKPALPAGDDLQRDMLHAGIAAGLEAAEGRRLTMPNWESIIRQKISDGMTEHLRAGGLQHDNTWRGGYSTHDRKFGSELGHAPGGEPIADESEEARTGAHEAEIALDAESAARAHAEARVDETGTEVTEAWTDDVDTADPTRDADASRGLESATKGTVTGRALPEVRAHRRQLAVERLTEKERAFYNAVQKAQGIDRYVAQYKPRAATAPAEWARVCQKLRDIGRELAAEGDSVEVAHTDVPANAGGAHVTGREGRYELSKRSAPVESAAGVESTRPVLSDAFSGAPKPSKVRGQTWRPYTWQSRGEQPLLRAKIGGSDRLDMAANVRRWERWRARLRAKGWGRPLLWMRGLID